MAQPDTLWCQQLVGDEDAVAQLEAVRALAMLPINRLYY
jgi:hypothetical protein